MRRLAYSSIFIYSLLNILCYKAKFMSILTLEAKRRPNRKQRQFKLGRGAAAKYRLFYKMIADHEEPGQVVSVNQTQQIQEMAAYHCMISPRDTCTIPSISQASRRLLLY